MLEELMLINLWLKSKEISYIHKLGINKTYFFVLKDVVEYIEEFIGKHKQLPSAELIATEFDDFRQVEDTDSIEYLVSTLKENKAYTEYRPVLTTNAQLVSEGKTIEAMWKMRADIDDMLKTYNPTTQRYDWVKHAQDRYTRYMENHGKTGLAGIPTGHSELDDLTGGWRDDDFVLLSARLGNGKSLVGGHFAYTAWNYVQKAKRNDPIIYITTEMPELEVAYRLDTLKKHFSNTALNRGKLTDEGAENYREYLEELSQKDSSFLILSQESNGGRAFTPNDIRALVESEKPAMLIVDQAYDLSDGTGEKDIRKRLVNVTNGIRDINLYTQTPTIFIAQANRESAKMAKKDINATPELHEIQETDAPAQKATRVVTLKLIGDDMLKLSLKKNRGGQREKDVFFRVDIDTGRWDEDSLDTACF